MTLWKNRELLKNKFLTISWRGNIKKSTIIQNESFRFTPRKPCSTFSLSIFYFLAYKSLKRNLCENTHFSNIQQALRRRPKHSRQYHFLLLIQFVHTPLQRERESFISFFFFRVFVNIAFLLLLHKLKTIIWNKFRAFFSFHSNEKTKWDDVFLPFADVMSTWRVNDVEVIMFKMYVEKSFAPLK